MLVDRLNGPPIYFYLSVLCSNLYLTTNKRGISMSDLVYSLAIEDDYYLMVVYDKPAWFRPSLKGLRFIPNDHDELQDALIIFGHNNLDFSKKVKDQIIQMIDDCHKKQGPDAYLEPWITHEQLMLEAKKELKNLVFKGNILVVNHGGQSDEADLSCLKNACKAKCSC